MGVHTLHVLMHKDELNAEQASGSAVVVLDVLFATSTIATALHNGATEVFPVLDAEEALKVGEELGGDCVLAGEKNAMPIPGFAPALPLALLQVGLSGKRLVYSTTNGTVGLRRAERARAVVAGSLLNGDAVARYLVERHPDAPVLLVCAGSAGRFNLEDFYGAGYLVRQLQAHAPGRFLLTDAALAALGLFNNPALTPEACLLGSRVGRMVTEWGMADEVRHAATPGLLRVVPVLQGRSLRAA
jgi:2-phosphosulfolactate phosphatase